MRLVLFLPHPPLVAPQWGKLHWWQCWCVAQLVHSLVHTFAGAGVLVQVPEENMSTPSFSYLHDDWANYLPCWFLRGGTWLEILWNSNKTNIVLAISSWTGWMWTLTSFHSVWQCIAKSLTTEFHIWQLSRLEAVLTRRIISADRVYPRCNLYDRMCTHRFSHTAMYTLCSTFKVFKAKGWSAIQCYLILKKHCWINYYQIK